jgi:hypothetical protein
MIVRIEVSDANNEPQALLNDLANWERYQRRIRDETDQGLIDDMEEIMGVLAADIARIIWMARREVVRNEQ